MNPSDDDRREREHDGEASEPGAEPTAPSGIGGASPAEAAPERVEPEPIPPPASGWSGSLTRGLQRHGPLLGALALAVLAFFVGTFFGDAPADSPIAEGPAEVWTCSMHPQIRQPEPGDCPICGMDLILADRGDGPPLPESQVRLSDRAIALAKVRTEEVRDDRAESADLRLLGRVDYDETSLRTLTAWTAGRLERLNVRVTGEQVRRGQVIASLFSPEVYAAHQDLLEAKRQVARLGAAGPAVRSGAERLLEATRERLRLLGVGGAALGRLERASRPSRTVAITSPFTGTVIERLATEGAYVQTGSPIYRLADLSRLWLQLDAYERDLPSLALGQIVSFTVDALPGEAFEGRVAFIDPVLDPRHRTARLRVEVQNTDGRLRPGMFAEATVRAAGAEGLMTIPASAPLFTGRRSIVYVQLPDRERPTYEARPVRLGRRMGERYPVLAGLSPGDRVVIAGAFLLDADLQIRGGTSMMSSPDDSMAHPIDEVVAVSDEFRGGLIPILAAYLRIQEALADDDLGTARDAAAVFMESVQAFDPEQPAAAIPIWARIAAELQGRAGHLHHTSDLVAARRAFEHISQEVIQMLSAFGNPLEEPLRVAHCPMALDDRGALWVQRGEELRNAYFGADMLSCGSIEATIGAGEHLLPGGTSGPVSPPASETPAAPTPPPEAAPAPSRGSGMRARGARPAPESPAPAAMTVPSAMTTGAEDHSGHQHHAGHSN